MYKETVSTCKFAQRVALITSEAFINEDEDPYMRINELKLEVDNLKKELALFKDPDNQLQYKAGSFQTFCLLVVIVRYS